MVITGYIRRVDAGLTPALIIDPATAAAGDPATLAAACLEAVDPALAERAGEGDVLVAGALLAGPGAEDGALALMAAGFAAVICGAADAELAAVWASLGLPVVAQPEASAALPEGAVVRIDLERGALEARGVGRWAFPPPDGASLGAARRARLLRGMRRVVEEEGFAE